MPLYIDDVLSLKAILAGRPVRQFLEDIAQFEGYHEQAVQKAAKRYEKVIAFCGKYEEY